MVTWVLIWTYRNVFLESAARKDSHQLRAQLSLGQEREDDALDDQARQVGLGRGRVVLLQGLAEDPQQDLRGFATLGLHLRRQAAVEHQVAQAAAGINIVAKFRRRSWRK